MNVTEAREKIEELQSLLRGVFASAEELLQTKDRQIAELHEELEFMAEQVAELEDLADRVFTHQQATIDSLENQLIKRN